MQSLSSSPLDPNMAAIVMVLYNNKVIENFLMRLQDLDLSRDRQEQWEQLGALLDNILKDEMLDLLQ